MFKLALAVILVLPSVSAAYFQEELIQSKVTARQSSQFNILDWLTQKKQIAEWDAWLALNTSANVFDLTLSGGYRQYDYTLTPAAGAKTEEPYTSEIYNLEMYLFFFNISGEYEKTENSRESFGGAAGLRLLGNSTQDTSLVARYGWQRARNLTTQEQVDSYYAEGVMQLYLASFLGIDGSYRHYFKAESNKNNEFLGSRTTGGVFLEFLVFRIYGQAFQEPMELTDSAGVVSKEDRRGTEVGLKMLF